MQTSTFIGVIVIIVLIALGGWYFYTNPVAAPAPAPTGDTGGDTGGATGDTNLDLNISVSDVPTSATVTYSSSGFSPSPVRVKAGGTITFVDQNPSADMWIASAQHPTHSVYDGTSLSQHCAPGAAPSFDQCRAGSSYTFTFDKAGTWNYHNHVLISHFGSVEVVQ